MTTAPAFFTHPLVVIKVGDIIWSHCRKCMGQTDHLYVGYRLICLHCHPDKDTRNHEPAPA